MFFEDWALNPRAKKASPINRASLLRMPIPASKPWREMTAEELLSGACQNFVFDVESYPNYFLASFRCLETGSVIPFELSARKALNVQWLSYILHRYCLIGFNSRNYDIIMCLLAAQGLNVEGLKRASDTLIHESLSSYEAERHFRVNSERINHIDLIEVAPLVGSLKLYGARLHCERLQELPYPDTLQLTEEQAQHVAGYNITADLPATARLYQELKPYIEQRELMGARYGEDFRSKSDAQIAEAVIKGELRKRGVKLSKSRWQEGDSFYYEPPAFLSFETPQLQKALELIRATPFYVGSSGHVDFPKALSGLEIALGQCVYRLGIGGLHSTEKSIAHKATKTVTLIDRDVASYYPRIIINSGIYPSNIGPAFIEVLTALTDERLAAKASKQTKLSDGLKITINGTFGKTSDPFAIMYMPPLTIYTTLTGQLSLLLCVEMVQRAGFTVLSGNTDGIVVKCPLHRKAELDAIFAAWEQRTGFVTEETEYKAIYSRDVNNYIAIKTNGEVKAKGVYSEKGSALNSVLSKNPETLICSDAVQAFLTKGTPLAHTIEACKDIRRFVSVRNVKGGAAKAGVFLGKVVRWYYAKGETGIIQYVLSGNKVPKTEGAKPLMDLPAQLPEDINYDWYINEAEGMLSDIGYYGRSAARTLFEQGENAK